MLRLCTAMYGYVRLCTIMYGYVRSGLQAPAGDAPSWSGPRLQAPAGDAPPPGRGLRPGKAFKSLAFHIS